MATTRALPAPPIPFVQRHLTLLLLLALLAALLATVPPHGAAASGYSVGDPAVVATDVLNVRTAPGTGNPVTDRLYQGDSVTISAVDGWASGYDWVQVGRVPGTPIGWVAAEYLSLPGAGSAAFVIGDRVLVDSGALNFRTGPGTGHTVIRPLAYATLLTITDGPVGADGYTWFQGRTTAATGGEIGWAIGEGLMPAPADMPDPCLEYDTGSVVHVATDQLRLRAEPGTGTGVVTTLPSGTTLTVTGMPVGAGGYTWYPVATGSGSTGWVAGMYLAGGGAPATLAVGSPARVDVVSLNLRSGPGLDAPVLRQLSSGTGVVLLDGPVTSDGYDWYAVETSNGSSGWVIGAALLPTS